MSSAGAMVVDANVLGHLIAVVEDLLQQSEAAEK